MNPEDMIDLLTRATQNVCSVMLGIQMSAGEPFTGEHLGMVKQGVVALVGMAGDWVGTGCVMCSPETACELASRLLSHRHTVVDEAVMDAMGELANIIVGNFKDDVAPHPGTLCLSIPTVIFGRNITTRSANGTHWTVLPFFFEDHRMEVRVCLQPMRRDHRGGAGVFIPALS